MSQLLALHMHGVASPKVLPTVIHAIEDCGCRVLDFRSAVQASEQSASALLGGPWNALAKLETVVPRLQQQLGITITTQRTDPRTPDEQSLGYMVEIVAPEQSETLQHVVEFFTSRNIDVAEMNANGYQLQHSGSRMFSIRLMVFIPSDQQLAVVREEFMTLCDQMNLDAFMEPLKS